MYPCIPFVLHSFAATARGFAARITQTLAHIRFRFNHNADQPIFITWSVPWPVNLMCKESPFRPMIVCLNPSAHFGS
jgi:hypothetical protein